MEDRPILISYPKSGRTWIRYMLGLAGINVEFSHAGTGSRWRELGTPFRTVDMSGYARPRMLFMHRNPIDTTVSFYFQVHRRDLVPGTVNYYRRLPIYLLTRRWPPSDLKAFVGHPGYGIEKVCRFNRAWLDHLERQPNSFVFTYEQVVSNGAETVGALLRFLGADPRQTSALIEQSSFEKMRSVETDETRGRSLSPGIAGDPESLKVRRGKVRGYIEYLDQETIDQCRRIAAAYGFDA